MILPALAVLVVFAYVPMYGIQVAFRNFNAADGITGSPWVGMKNFMFFFKSIYLGRLTFNTLFLNMLFLVSGLAMQISTAVLINEVLSRRFQKVLQTAMFFPYFLSWIVVSTLVNALLSDSMGILNKALRMLGAEGVIWYKEAKYWPAILTIASVWKGDGIRSRYLSGQDRGYQPRNCMRRPVSTAPVKDRKSSASHCPC